MKEFKVVDSGKIPSRAALDAHIEAFEKVITKMLKEGWTISNSGITSHHSGYYHWAHLVR